MYDLEDFLSGKLSIDCRKEAEVSAICDLMQEHGIDEGSLRSIKKGGFRVDVGRKLHGAYSNMNAEWYVRHGFTQRWMPYAEFMASIKLPSTITLDDLV